LNGLLLLLGILVGFGQVRGIAVLNLGEPTAATSLLRSEIVASEVEGVRAVVLTWVRADPRTPLVVDERVRWADLEATVKSAAGTDLERIQYRDTYRDRERLGPGKKSQLLTVLFRRGSGTLTGTEADQIRDQIVAACQKAHGASIRA